MQVQGVRPRDDYGPRKLLPDTYGRRIEYRAYDKKPDDPRGVEAIPAEWAVICPNRVAERSRAAGYPTTKHFARALGSISYQRLKRIEIGRVLVRESEYELIADHLELDVEALKLPLLTLEETTGWNRLWGPEKLIEEGGDHDSVVLSAYVRMLVEETGSRRNQIAREMGFNTNTLSFIWYAEKPIDRYPDSTMSIVIRLSGAENWDEVILASRKLYEEGQLKPYVLAIQQPRIRYAPEDPDRRAPWTYETDPLRVRERRRAVQTPLSAVPLPGTKVEREKAARLAERQRVRDEARAGMLAIIERVRHADLEMLHEVFPADPEGVRKLKALPLSTIRTMMARTLIARTAARDFQRIIAAELLGVSKERVRQMYHAYDQCVPLASGGGMITPISELAN